MKRGHTSCLFPHHLQKGCCSPIPPRLGPGERTKILATRTACKERKKKIHPKHTEVQSGSGQHFSDPVHERGCSCPLPQQLLFQVSGLVAPGKDSLSLCLFLLSPHSHFLLFTAPAGALSIHPFSRWFENKFEFSMLWMPPSSLILFLVDVSGEGLRKEIVCRLGRDFRVGKKKRG